MLAKIKIPSDLPTAIKQLERCYKFSNALVTECEQKDLSRFRQNIEIQKKNDELDHLKRLLATQTRYRNFYEKMFCAACGTLTVIVLGSLWVVSGGFL